LFLKKKMGEELSHFKRLVNQFNQHENTLFLQKLLDVRCNNRNVFVPEGFRKYIESPVPLKPYQRLVREVAESNILPSTENLDETYKKCVKDIHENQTFEEFCTEKIYPNTCFWTISLSPFTGSEKIYTWENYLYKEIMDDYLRRLESVLRYLPVSGETENDFQKICEYFPSLYFFSVPLRIELGEEGVYASETILSDYAMITFPSLFEILFPSDEESVVKAINPMVIESEFPHYVKIDHSMEREIIYNGQFELDESWTDEEGFSIFWWLPDHISSHLDDIVKESKPKKDNVIDEIDS